MDYYFVSKFGRLGEARSMKELMLEKLGKIENLEQRKVLKEILTGFFINLIDYQTEVNQRLEERVFSEIDDTERKYDLYFTVCPKNNLDPLDNFWHPVFPEEIVETKCDLKEIIAKLQKNEVVSLFTVFLKCDYLLIKKLTAGKKSFQGELITDRKRYPIRVRLQQNQKHLLLCEHLYQVFQKNAIPWKTLNHPYANKFFDVVITYWESLPETAETINEIVINLEEYDRYKQINLALLWNVEPLQISSTGFPMPALDRINYEHVLSIKKNGCEHGYLIDEEQTYIRYSMRTDEAVTIVSPHEKIEAWNLMKITRLAMEPTGNPVYGIGSNRRTDSFVAKFSQKQGAVIRTRGEIYRIVNSFAISAYFQLQNIRLSEHKGERDYTYDCNYFLADDIRVANEKKMMILSFTPINLDDNYLIYDWLSFLVSEVQMYFPDYECVGELV
jgi:hypothetical protein